MSKKLSVYSTQASHSGQMIQTDAANNFWEQIEYAYHQNISFLGTGGGHGYSATLDTVENGIEIDLGHFNTVSIDRDANTMTVGGSVHFANITGLLYDAGKEFRT